MRWLLAPFFLGLFIAILALLYKFIIQLYQLLMQLAGCEHEPDRCGVFKLVDFALIANLLLMAVFAAGMKGTSSITSNQKNIPIGPMS